MIRVIAVALVGGDKTTHRDVTASVALMVASTPRTGSGLLCSALWSTGLCGQPDEYLAWETRREYEVEWATSGHGEYIEQLLARTTTANGVFSMKVHCEHTPNTIWIEDAIHVASPTPLERLSALAPKVYFVWLSRRDRIRQAVSRYRRLTSRLKPPPNVAPSVDAARDVVFDYAAIRALVEELDEYERRWGESFHDAGIEPMRLWYEDNLEHDYAEAVHSILEMMCLDVPRELAVTTDFKKQADAVSEELVRMYLAADRDG